MKQICSDGSAHPTLHYEVSKRTGCPCPRKKQMGGQDRQQAEWGKGLGWILPQLLSKNWKDLNRSGDKERQTDIKMERGGLKNKNRWHEGQRLVMGMIQTHFQRNTVHSHALFTSLVSVLTPNTTTITKNADDFKKAVTVRPWCWYYVVSDGYHHTELEQVGKNRTPKRPMTSQTFHSASVMTAASLIDDKIFSFILVDGCTLIMYWYTSVPLWLRCYCVCCRGCVCGAASLCVTERQASPASFLTSPCVGGRDGQRRLESRLQIQQVICCLRVAERSEQEKEDTG